MPSDDRPDRVETGAVDLFWLPLGAGGQSVRLNGRVYEGISALREHRGARDLYHSALEVTVSEGRFVIEMTPVRRHQPGRQIVASGPVGAAWAARWRILRYEVCCWQDGVIPDVVEAVDSPHRLINDESCARRLLEILPALPTPVWGRDELRTGEMWNSNSVTAWLLAASGVAQRVDPPAGGCAPGWRAGLTVARLTGAWRAGLSPKGEPAPAALRAFADGDPCAQRIQPMAAGAYARPMTSTTVHHDSRSPRVASRITDNPPPEDTPMFTNLVVGVDGRDGGRDAMRLAHQLADRSARITLVHVYGDTEGPPGSGSALVEDQRTGGLDLLARERQRNWPDAETICVYDPSPGKALHQIARRQDADLLVVGSCHHGAVGRVLLGDDTRAAFNGTPCALAIAPRCYSAHEGGLRLIGVGYIDTPESERALTVARQLARTSGASVEVVWVISREDVRHEAPLPADWPQEDAVLVGQAQQRLDQITGISGYAVSGGPREELARLAHRADLLIVGSRGYGPVGSVFHGSVSSYLERHAASALLILPHELPAAVGASPGPDATSAVTA